MIFMVFSIFNMGLLFKCNECTHAISVYIQKIKTFPFVFTKGAEACDGMNSQKS